MTQMEPQVVRFNELKPCKTAFIDAHTPGSDEKDNFTIIGSGVSESPDQYVHISQTPGFNIGAAGQPPKCINSLHSHTTAEVFFVLNGRWRFFWGRWGTAGEVIVEEGDIFNIPFKDKSFEHVFCLGVIQHTPDPTAAFISLASKVKQGGFLYIDVYTQSWYHYLHWKYILRPLTKRLNREKLYRLISFIAPKLIPVAKFLRKWFGRAGARLIPIVEFSHLGLSRELNEQWSILDTFDMYSPAHDHPQSKKTVESWFKVSGFKDIEVWYGDNGVVGKGRKK